MRTYAFRITCMFSGGDFETKEEECVLTLPASVSPIQLSLPKPDSNAQSRTLGFLSGGFPSKEDAWTAGERLKTAVMLAGPLLGVGIDVGTNQVLSPALKRKDRTPDERLQPQVHGLQVFPEIEGMVFGGLYFGRPVKRLSVARFEKALANGYALDRPLTTKLTLAIQLWSQSHFRSSDAARFVTLVTAVEALTEQRLHSDGTQHLIDRMVKMTDNLGHAEGKAVADGLGRLRRQSISSACGELVRTYCGAPQAQHFGQAYRIRSKMLHGGAPPPGTDVAAECRRLDTLVRELLVNIVNAHVRVGA